MKAIEYDGDLNEFLEKYHYCPDLTRKLDSLKDASFTQEIINNIVLWKLNRYVRLDDVILQSMESLRKLETGEHKKSEPVLKSLLDIHGIDLPMASTILRFLNPSAFQIIDKHAYRAIYAQNYPLYSSSSDSRKINVYFDYLDKLIDICNRRNLDFETIDRLLYVFDKFENGKLSQ